LVPRVLCDEYKEKHFKNERALKYPLLWEFDTEMIDDLKYMGVDLTSWSYGKSGLHFKNKE